MPCLWWPWWPWTSWSNTWWSKTFLWVVRGFFRHPFGRISLALLLAGAVGNLIDRAFQGYVVDMFHVLFMEFAVFNVADICVVVGGIAAAVYYMWGYERLEKGLHPQEHRS